MALAFVFGSCHPTLYGPLAKSSRPKLVVMIVIDQFPTWTFEKQKALFTGGLARLLREGAYIPAAELPYANTFTAASHATIATGAPPRVHGIVGDSWWRRGEQRERPAEYDPDSPLLRVGAPGGKDPKPEDAAASAKALRVEGVADVLRAATGGRAHSVAIALKARSAVLMAGQHPDLAVWYEPAGGGMTTSKAYAAEPPRWLVNLAETHPASHYFGATWTPRDPALLAKFTGIPDDAPGESADLGLGRAFPHPIAAEDPEHALLHTPFGDELVMTTIAAALDALELGKDDVPDLLAVSFGAHDFAGHAWGPDSWEVVDLTLRLDTALGQMFDALDARLGKGNWAVVLTSDHGATPLVERARIRSARRISPKEIEKAAETALVRQLGPGPWVAKLSADNLYLTPQFGELPAGVTHDAALAAAAHAMEAVPGVAVAGASERFAAGCDNVKDLDRAICLALVPGEAGELYAFPTAGSTVGDRPTGTNHDAPFEDNRHVPLLAMGPGIPHTTSTGTLLQIAPTLAALLGVPPPREAHELPLFGLRPAPPPAPATAASPK